MVLFRVLISTLLSRSWMKLFLNLLSCLFRSFLNASTIFNLILLMREMSIFWCVYGEISITSIRTDSWTFMWGTSLGIASLLTCWLIILGHLVLFLCKYITYLGYVFLKSLLVLFFPSSSYYLCLCFISLHSLPSTFMSLFHKILCIFWQLGLTNEKKLVFLRLTWFLNMISSSWSLLTTVCPVVWICCMVFSWV